jgi:hypothetical protein
MTKLDEMENETELLMEGNSENKHEFSVSNEEIFNILDSKIHKHTDDVSEKITDIKGMIAQNALESGSFDNETVSNNKLENSYENFVDYEGVTTYSILERPQIVMESIVADEYPNTIKERIDEDIDSYKNPPEVMELGIEAELEYEQSEKRLKDNEEWVSPFKSFKSEI